MALVVLVVRPLNEPNPDYAVLSNACDGWRATVAMQTAHLLQQMLRHAAGQQRQHCEERAESA